MFKKNLVSTTILYYIFFVSFLASNIVFSHNSVRSFTDEEKGPRSIDFPDPEGYVTVVTDLHTHTTFSDGHVWPSIRVEEAIRDNVDVISLTEHLEYQPHLEDIPNQDRNRSFFLGKTAAENNDLIVINGAEVTRQMNDEKDSPGHINAVFIEDANKLYQHDESKREEAIENLQSESAEQNTINEFYAITNLWPVENAMREANKQGAFVFWNHPSWSVQRPDGITILGDIHKTLIAEKLLHGIEVTNGDYYSEAAFQVALDNQLTVIGTSDVHELIDWDYKPYHGGHRPVTLVLAELRTEQSIKEALFARRTVVWFKDMLIGEASNVSSLLEASLIIGDVAYLPDTTILKVTIDNISDATFRLKNLSDYTFAKDDDYIEIPEHSQKVIEVNAIEKSSSVELEFEVLNALIAPKKHPRLKFEVIKH